MIFSIWKAKSLKITKLITLLMLGFCLFSFNKLSAKEKIILQLSWKHQFQFAGYYAALEKGYYASAGFDVEIREAPQAESVINEILNGNADFAIGDAEILIYYMRGQPIALIASIFQHSPSVLLVKSTSNIHTPQDLVGKVLMLGEDMTGIEILTMIYSEGLNREQFTVVPKSFSVNDLLSDKVDGITAYISNEPFFMEKFGIPYRVINPTNYGIDFYSDCLFCSQTLIKTKPERVNKFREASIKGWEYALANKEEIAYLIVNKYNSAKTIDHLLYEANEIEKLIKPDFIEIGHINKWRWQRIAEYLYQYGIIENIISIDEFIYSPKLGNKYLWLKITGIIVGIILVSISIIYLFHRKLNLLVQKRTKEIQLLVKKLEEQNSEIQRINIDLLNAKDLTRETEENRFIFFSKIINELRNPVNSLIELSEHACRTNLSDDQKTDVCSRIGYNSKILQDFINDIIAISNIDGDEKFYSLNETSLDNLISNFLTELKSDTRVSNRVTLKQNVNAENPQKKILVEQDKLYKVIRKLVSNSLKFTEQGIIEIGCEISSPTSLLLWVKDTGYGIKPEVVRRINDFFSDPPVTNTSGIGLGLWVSKTLIHNLNGNIWVESELGKGSKFYIQVPCVYVDKLDITDSGMQTNQSNWNFNNTHTLITKKMLILDENVSNLNLIKTLARGTGISIMYTDSLDESLLVLRSNCKVDIMLLCGENGKELSLNNIIEIRNINPDIPVVVYMFKEINEKWHFLELGFSDVLQITSPQNQLIEILSKHLHNKDS